MRSRPKLTVLLAPGVPRPGELLDVEARLESTSETPLDGVSFTLSGLECVTVRRGKSTSVWKHSHLSLRAQHPAAVLTPGLHTYRAQFQLPPDLPPRYLGRYTRLAYTLEVRASIPWWPDRVGLYDVPIVPRVAPVTPVAGVFVSEREGARIGELYAEMSLAATTLEPGGEIVGTVAFSNVVAGKVRGVRVALVAFEKLFTTGSFLEGGSYHAAHEVLRWDHVLANRAPEDGQSIPFRLAIARDTVPTFSAAISGLTWAVEVTVERPWSNLTLLRAPVVIVPATGTAQRPRSAAAPAVGRARRAQSWHDIGARMGLPYDPERDELRGAAGAVAIHMAVETRADGTLATVARLSWPQLGMGLKLAPGSWTDRLASHEIDVGFDDFDRRFHVRGRVPEQVRALLDEKLCTLLAGFGDATATADDEGATFLVPVALVDARPLGDFVARVIETARGFDAGLARVPLPPALAATPAAAERWRDFAARLGGRFEPGRGAIHEATFGPERLEIVTRWSDAGDFETTAIHLPLGLQIDIAAIAPAARTLATSLEQQTGTRVTLTSDAVTLTVTRLVPDPAELEPLLEHATHLVQMVRGRGSAGPFR